MKISKIEKIDKEIAALEKRVKDIQEKIKTLKDKRKEEENLHIINTVRKSNITIDELILAVDIVKSPNPIIKNNSERNNNK